MDCIVHRVTKSRTCLSDFHFQETKTLKAMQQKKKINVSSLFTKISNVCKL